jgi:large repetitive protein
VHDAYYLTSPAINTAGASTVSFSFWRWLNSDYVPFMQNTVEVYNGVSWVTLWQSGGPPGTQDASWQQMTFDLTQYKNANMRVRFGQRNGPQAGAFSVSSWNIDDVVIASAPCQ